MGTELEHMPFGTGLKTVQGAMLTAQGRLSHQACNNHSLVFTTAYCSQATVGAFQKKLRCPMCAVNHWDLPFHCMLMIVGTPELPKLRS